MDKKTPVLDDNTSTTNKIIMKTVSKENMLDDDNNDVEQEDYHCHGDDRNNSEQQQRQEHSHVSSKTETTTSEDKDDTAATTATTTTTTTMEYTKPLPTDMATIQQIVQESMNVIGQETYTYEYNKQTGRIIELTIGTTLSTPFDHHWDLSPSIQHLDELQRLSLTSCRSLPEEIGLLSSLKSLTLIACKRMEQFPSVFSNGNGSSSSSPTNEDEEDTTTTTNDGGDNSINKNNITKCCCPLEELRILGIIPMIPPYLLSQISGLSHLRLLQYAFHATTPEDEVEYIRALLPHHNPFLLQRTIRESSNNNHNDADDNSTVPPRQQQEPEEETNTKKQHNTNIHDNNGERENGTEDQTTTDTIDNDNGDGDNNTKNPILLIDGHHDRNDHHHRHYYYRTYTFKHTLTHLILNRCTMSTHGMNILVNNVVPYYPSLKCLSLAKNKIKSLSGIVNDVVIGSGGDGMVSPTTSPTTRTIQLEELILSDNPIWMGPLPEFLPNPYNDENGHGEDDDDDDGDDDHNDHDGRDDAIDGPMLTPSEVRRRCEMEKERMLQLENQEKFNLELLLRIKAPLLNYLGFRFEKSKLWTTTAQHWLDVNKYGRRLLTVSAAAAVETQQFPNHENDNDQTMITTTMLSDHHERQLCLWPLVFERTFKSFNKLETIFGILDGTQRHRLTPEIRAANVTYYLLRNGPILEERKGQVEEEIIQDNK